jgi:2-polyprenyl-3-methyl-5-hydroxy-6-metoxy-1,4-benzoquinol methylase
LKKLFWQLLIKLGFYPHIYFTYSPFKILEFEELTGDIPWRGNERVLDIGCGIGNHTLLLGKACGHITGIDTNPDFIAEARWFSRQLGGRVNADFDHRPLEEIAYPDNTFDYVFSICVLEHIPDHESILREALRILKPGGRMIFSVDSLEAIDDPELIEIHRQAHHVQKYYRTEELKSLLEDTGFRDVDVYPIFRSAMAVKLFKQGIREGFNFGRLRTRSLTLRFLEAEAEVESPTAGIFLIAKTVKPESGAVD